MIAKNYIRYPEALRFQVELFSRGYKNQPRIMRLLEVICDWSPTAPEWFKQARKRASNLAKRVRQALIEFNFKEPAKVKKTPGYYYGPNGETWSGRGLQPRWIRVLIERTNGNKNDYLFSGEEKPTDQCNPRFRPALGSNGAHGAYRKHCQNCNNWASYCMKTFDYGYEQI